MTGETRQILAHIKSLVAELNETSDQLIRSLEKDDANEASAVDGRARAETEATAAGRDTGRLRSLLGLRARSR